MSMKKKTARKNPRGITRIDQESTRTHGWFVRVGWSRKRNGSYAPKHTRFFGDVSHGGKKKALAAAEKFVGSVARPKKAKKTARKKTARKKK